MTNAEQFEQLFGYTATRGNDMKLNCRAYDSLCSLERFEINGIKASYTDFGEKEDCNPEEAEPYGCGNMCFIRKGAEQKILDKYNISLDEYNEVCDKLEEELSFGNCGLCI